MIPDLPAYLEEHFSAAWREAHAAPGYVQSSDKKVDTPMKVKSGGQFLGVGDQMPICGRTQTMLAFISAAAKIYDAQLGGGSEGPSRREAFMALISATGSGTLLPWASNV